MIDYSQIQRLASKIGIPEEIIEKDYFIELILFYLAKDDYFKKNVIFRGGTALKKIYFSDYRFSEDLDFLTDHRENLLEIEYRLTQFLSKINTEYPFHLSKRSEHNKDRIQFFILYDIIPEIRVTKELKIDVLKDSIIPTFQKRKILFTYQEFNQDKLYLKTYNLESIISDKIGRILDVNNEARDIYDLCYLLKLNVDTQKIQEEFKIKYGCYIYVPNLLSEIAKDNYKRNWQIRLEKQISNLRSYETVFEELEKLIEVKLSNRKV